MTGPAAADATAPRMRWWGWGVDGHDPELTAGLSLLLDAELGLDGASTPPGALEEVRLPDARAPEALRARLADAGVVRDDHLARVTHAYGRSYPDLVRLRTGDGSAAPDLVVYPADEAGVAAVLAACAQADAAVVPFGGGTSVVGGVEGLRGARSCVVSLDLARLDRLVACDAAAQTATFDAGILGPAAEDALAAHGLTLGHFPQSFEFSTLGGWVATRSAGQASTGYGRIDELVLGLRCVTPSGAIETRALPATAAGPDLRELLVGSEGALGVITQVTVRVRPRAAARRYEALSLPSFEAGLEAFRALEQQGVAPDVARLSDEEETRLTLTLAGESRAAGALRGYLRARGRGRGCLAILGWEGTEVAVRRRRHETVALLRREHDAFTLGTKPGAKWEQGRFHGPYLRDVLMNRGALVDTLETATTWDRIPGLYRAVGGALRDSLGARGTPAFVMCHVSHLYPTGCSLYFTFAARAERDAPLEQWHAAKSAAGDAILGAGGTITHHHAVGRDHAPWLREEVGPLGVELLRAAKERLDPKGIMNPGKLVDAEPLPGAP